MLASSLLPSAGTLLAAYVQRERDDLQFPTGNSSDDCLTGELCHHFRRIIPLLRYGGCRRLHSRGCKMSS